MLDLKQEVVAEQWAALINIKERIIRKGDILIEVTESASAGFITKVMESSTGKSG